MDADVDHALCLMSHRPLEDFRELVVSLGRCSMIAAYFGIQHDAKQ